MRALLNKTIFFILLGFFVSRVFISLMRLGEGKIGLAQEKVRSNKVQYPSISLCIYGSSNVSVLASGEVEAMNITDNLESLAFGGIVNDRWGRKIFTSSSYDCNTCDHLLIQC